MAVGDFVLAEAMIVAESEAVAVLDFAEAVRVVFVVARLGTVGAVLVFAHEIEPGVAEDEIAETAVVEMPAAVV